MAADNKLLPEYLHVIEKQLAAGDSTEHTHRPALKALIEKYQDGITATNEPKHIECGAPDFIIKNGIVTIGYIETKDIDKSLDEAEKSDQLKRYRDSLSNLILTDYLEYRWFVDGERKLTARLGMTTGGGKIKPDTHGIPAVGELIAGFLTHKAQSAGSPKELAVRMAHIGHMIRNLIINTFEKEPVAGSLHSELAAFRENLIPDLDKDQFADMYTQTIAYGLFAARCTQPDDKNFTRQNAAYLIPRTNPFLRNTFNFIAGPDLDERIAWLVDDLAQLLGDADMAAVMEYFGKRTGKEDPVIHFYETFLKEYNPEVREMRGVYYTPAPVVSYIVRSIDHLLKTRFNRPQGLADENTLILDPAVGTATFLYTVINEIYSSLVSHGQQGAWNNYVSEKLLPRLFGFELLMAPYAIAHLKLGLQLQETGYKFQSDQRLGIYLTNTLEESFKKSELLPGFNKYIVDEANAAAEIKKEKPIMVVLGNPPYSKASANKGEYIEKLMERYKTAVRSERNIQPLSDDYIKFIRFAHERIERTGYGIIGMITNNSYLSGLIHRGMREELIKSFDEIYILDLHGSALLGERTIDKGKDENVFDIRQGVSIVLLIRKIVHKEATEVYYADLWDLRENKYKVLAESDIKTTPWIVLKPNNPYYFFLPKGLEFKNEYNTYLSLLDIFPLYSSGIKTHRDHFVIDYDSSILKQRITNFRDITLDDDKVKEQFDLVDTGNWNVTDARSAIRSDNDWDRAFTKCLYRPFDVRHIFYHKSVIDRPRSEVMGHVLAGKNLGLVADRTTSLNLPFTHIFTANFPIDVRVLPDYGGAPFVFPLYLYPTENELEFKEGHRLNLDIKFIESFSEILGLKFVEDGKGDLKETFGPEDIFNYTYAVFHSPAYRTRYAEFLKIDFPRLPLTSNKELFKALVDRGGGLVALHLMESPLLNPDRFITKYAIGGDNIVEKVVYLEKDRCVYINKKQFFEGIPPEVWNFHVGGYQVCQKWLKDRKGRELSYDDVSHYQKIVVALNETIRLMKEIDEVIEKHGGWPGAFESK